MISSLFFFSLCFFGVMSCWVARVMFRRCSRCLLVSVYFGLFVSVSFLYFRFFRRVSG